MCSLALVCVAVKAHYHCQGLLHRSLCMQHFVRSRQSPVDMLALLVLVCMAMNAPWYCQSLLHR